MVLVSAKALSGVHRNNQWRDLSRHYFLFYLMKLSLDEILHLIFKQEKASFLCIKALQISTYLVICVIQLNNSVTILCFVIRSLWFCSLECKNKVSAPELFVGMISFVFERSRGGISTRGPAIVTGVFLYFLQTNAWKVSRHSLRFKICLNVCDDGLLQGT
jgi:hypothetical protein